MYLLIYVASNLQTCTIIQKYTPVVNFTVFPPPLQVLEKDKANVVVLVQRALLYESTEKYRLGAEDLRLVLKIDPANRLARSTIHRLNKLAD
jgi:hypothetical protein